MAHKKSSSRKKPANIGIPVVRESTSKSVHIKKAQNGFVVSSFTDAREKTMIAKTKSEAKKFADKLLGL